MFLSNLGLSLHSRSAPHNFKLKVKPSANPTQQMDTSQVKYFSQQSHAGCGYTSSIISKFSMFLGKISPFRVHVHELRYFFSCSALVARGKTLGQIGPLIRFFWRLLFPGTADLGK